MYPPVHQRNFASEFKFSSSRSSGPGGQNVNKVNTKVELRFSVDNSGLLSDSEKLRLHIKLSNKINSEGELVISAQQERSQIGNKKVAVQVFYKLISEALKKPQKRIKTRPTRNSVEQRIQNKKKLSEKKKFRKSVSRD